MLQASEALPEALSQSWCSVHVSGRLGRKSRTEEVRISNCLNAILGFHILDCFLRQSWTVWSHSI